MTDRELLEAAARAAGIELHYDGDGANAVTYYGSTMTWERWNPLEDDGDALRLAVKLGLLWTPELSHFLSIERFSAQEHDDYYAHRRAIVRAAAALSAPCAPTLEQML